MSDSGKSSDYQYLEKLEFRPELRKGFLNFFITNFRVVILLMLLLAGVGIYSYIVLPVESDPEVKIPMAVVTTVFPGASPANVEDLVTKKLETEIAGLKDIDKITSNSSNSISSITVEFDADADLDGSIRKLRDAVDDAKEKIPEDANDPAVTEISVDDTPIFSISIAGPYDGFVLRDFAEDVQTELEKISGVREVMVSGGDEREFEIAYDPEKLAFYDLSPLEANRIVAESNLQIPGGNFQGSEYNYAIRTDARFFDAEALGNIPVFHTADGAIVYLKDMAEVRDRAIKKTVFSRFSLQGEKPADSVNIDIVKKTGGSIIKTADASKVKLDEMIKGAPAGITYDITIDTAKEIRKNFDQLVHDFTLTIILVFAILFLVIGLKEALVASLAIPLVFFATFGVMLQVGISLNFLSMISLILALGLLVDDAIVVVSATKQYLRTGKFTPEEAVLLVLNDFKMVLLTTTLTTVWAFLPLLFASGIIGQYIRSIPITVSVTLLASLAIALLINHPLAAVLERVRLTRKTFFAYLALVVSVGISSWYVQGLIVRTGLLSVSAIAAYWMLDWYFRQGKTVLRANAELMDREWRDDGLIKEKLRTQSNHEEGAFLSRLIHGIIRFDRLIPVYEKYLRKILITKKRRIATVVSVTFLLFAAVVLPITGVVKSEFFPVVDSELIFVNVEAPVGLRLEETEKIVSQVEDRLTKHPEIISLSTVVGSGGFSGGFINSSANPSHKAQITLKLQEEENRAIKSYDFAEVLRRDIADIQGAAITVQTLSGGPPSGSAFEAQIIGDDLDVLDGIAQDLKPILASVPGVVDAEISLKNSPADYVFLLDHNRMELLGVDASQIGSTMRMAISGTEVTDIIKGGDEIKVIARFGEEKIPDLEALQNLQIKNNAGESIFLRDVAQIRLEPSVDKITRINQRRTVLLSAGVSGEISSTDAVAEFQNKIKDYGLPQGYEIVYGGENEQNAESVQSIIRAMAIALVLIIATLVIQFNSFKKTFIVLVTIPLALIGVFFGLALFGVSLSFPGLIGIVALFGIVVKNAIILVDKINLNVRTGIAFFESVIDAGKSRLEAITITSVCTIAGITPVTLSNETWLAMGSTIIFGLLLSSFLTLFVIPTLYVMLIDDDSR
ncbi:MAG: efflux RND transporter permease subunit [Parcubacteria group bacterium]